MQWHKLRRTVSWLVRGWVLFAAVAVYGQEPALTDPALGTSFPYQQEVPHVAGVQVGMRVDQNTAQQIVTALPAEILGYLHPYHWRFLGEQVLLTPGLVRADHKNSPRGLTNGAVAR